MQQRVALVTGGTGGIGGAIVRQLLRQGHHVATNYRSHEKADALLAALTAEGFAASPLLVPGDVSDPVSSAAMVAEVAGTYGTIEILINNAGITRDATFHKMSYEQWCEVIGTNLHACFNVTRPVIEGMRQRRWGRVIQISSVNGQKGQYGQANYAAAKAGIHGFTISLAQENAKFGITVNTISPGYVATDMVMAVPPGIREKIIEQIPLGRFGKPEEIAHAASFLIAEESCWITGSNLAINGGQYMGW